MSRSARDGYGTSRQLTLIPLSRADADPRNVLHEDDPSILVAGSSLISHSSSLWKGHLKTRRNGRIIKVERRALHGAAWRFEDALNNSEDSSTLNTSFIERLNLTIRQSSAYLSRRTLSHARSTERLDEHLELLRCYYNFVRPHGALKFGREIRTPAMQAGLTIRRLTFRDIFLATTIPLWSRIEVFLLTGARNPVLCQNSAVLRRKSIQR